MGFAPATVIDGPPRLALPFGLFSVVSLAEAATERWTNGVSWQALTCEPVNVVVADCDAPEGFPQTFPDEYPPMGTSRAFTVYGTYKGNPIGCGMTEAQDRARQVLLAREEAAAEQRLWDTFDHDPTVLTGGDVIESLGVLEKWLGDVYGSLGVVHASRNAATTLTQKGLIRPSGNRMFTNLGTPVVVGAGYPGTGDDGAAATAGSEFIAATPALFGYRSGVYDFSNRSGDLLDRTDNSMYGIASRDYLIGYEPCGVAFAALTLGCC